MQGGEQRATCLSQSLFCMTAGCGPDYWSDQMGNKSRGTIKECEGWQSNMCTEHFENMNKRQNHYFGSIA